MKRILATLLFLTMIWTLAAPGQAVTQEADDLVLDAPPFVLCERDDECEPIIGICGMWVGVNSALKNEAIEILAELNSYRNCEPVQLKKPESIGCNDGQCDFKPDKNSCMLYSMEGKCDVKCLALTPEGFCEKGCMIGVDCP